MVQAIVSKEKGPNSRYPRILRSGWLLRLVQASCFIVAAILAFLLRFDFQIPPDQFPHLLSALPVLLVLKALAFLAARADRDWWRYVTAQDAGRLALANAAGSLLSTAIILGVGPAGFPRAIYLLDFLVCLGLTAGVRLTLRSVYEAARSSGRNGSESQRTLVYGAGDAGAALLFEIRQNLSLPYRVLGLIDDDPAKRGLVVQGARVLGRGSDLRETVRRLDIDTVLIAIPSATGAQMSRILAWCEEAGVAHKTVPGLAEVIEGRTLAAQVRDVAVEDLLGREPVRLRTSLISSRYRGKVVMVTGAAGSIGSELCRQLARFGPAAIVGYDVAETPLYLLEREMQLSFAEVPFHAVIGCIQDRARLDAVLERHTPSAVFHAAAYKHVPLMEDHAFAAVRNNIIGTYNVASAAASAAVDDFVMISTDKAVRPTSVMGVSKRVAELAVRSLGRERCGPARPCSTKFVSVRFGNVLGSNGSVIPIFKQQIAAGGPVTITHAEMRRYFMTIPEAAQLVLEASTMGEGGEIFVLDMGKPVRILDLARNLIHLSGFEPGKGIEIRFTGLRPGEKLYEEINTEDEHHIRTAHEKIRIFAGNGLPNKSVREYVLLFEEICRKGDAAALLRLLKELVPDYVPGPQFAAADPVTESPVTPALEVARVRAADSIGPGRENGNGHSRGFPGLDNGRAVLPLAEARGACAGD